MEKKETEKKERRDERYVKERERGGDFEDEEAKKREECA